MKVGEVWAYQHHANRPLVSVRVDAIGSKHPARVKVLFLSDSFEGAVEWVPPARLKCVWLDRSKYEARERAWHKLRSAGSGIAKPSLEATQWVFDEFRERLGAFRVHSSKEGRNRVTGVTSWPVLKLATGLLKNDLQSPVAIVEGEITYLPWPAGEQIAKAFVAQNRSLVLDALGRESEKWARGTYFRYSREWQEEFSREILRDWEHCRDLIYSWAGAPIDPVADRLAATETLLMDARTRLRETVRELILRGQADLAWEHHKWIYPEAGKNAWLNVIRMERALRADREGESQASLEALTAARTVLLAVLQDCEP